MSFGDTLREARERLRLTLDDAADATKISRRYLLALECEELEKLPAGVFRHGFLRSYAQFLKLDPAVLIAQMDAPTGDDVQEVITPQPPPVTSLLRLLSR